MAEWNITIEDILKKSKRKMKIFNFFCKISTNCTILVTKTLILSDYENVVFILINDTFMRI